MSTYAIFLDRGKQYGVREGEVVLVDLMPDAKPGSAISFKDVSLVRTGSATKVGRPHVSGASVTGEVTGTQKGEKTQAFKFKKRKNYHRKVGHRAKFTAVKVKSIVG